MKDKVMIFMCSLVLTLAATESVLAATESATGLVLAQGGGGGGGPPGGGGGPPGGGGGGGGPPGGGGGGPPHDDRCPGKSPRDCYRAGGEWHGHYCIIEKGESTKKCDHDYRKTTTRYDIVRYRHGECKHMSSYKTECRKGHHRYPNSYCKHCDDHHGGDDHHGD